MSKSRLFNKVPGQNIFREATSISLVMFMIRWMPIAAIFLDSFYLPCSQLFRGGVHCAMAPPLKPLEESETDSKGRPFL